MNELKELNVEAYEYMASIPSNAWSRHAFDTVCKSNMLLNNLYKSFKHALKPASDSSLFVLTHMEWIRRFFIQRHHIKRDRFNVLEGGCFPT